jgi:RND superfamily putative drug exporter
VLDHPLPFQASAVRRETVLVVRPVDVDLPAVRLSLPPGALSVLERLRRDLGDELDDLWGPAVAAEWTYLLALAAVSKARLVAIDGTGMPTAHLQHALGIMNEALPLGTTVVVAHHGARLEMGVRPVVVVELRPAPLVPEPLPELAELVPGDAPGDVSVDAPGDVSIDASSDIHTDVSFDAPDDILTGIPAETVAPEPGGQRHAKNPTPTPEKR